MSQNQEPTPVPVNSDKRSLEQKHRDRVSHLRRQHSQSSSDRTLRESALSPSAQWSNEIDQWVNSTNRLWTDVMRRMRQNQFALVPVDAADLDPFCAVEAGDSLGYVQSILSRMDRQMQTLRKQMSQVRPPEPMHMLPYDTSSDGVFGPIVPEGGLKGGPLGFLKDAFQLGEDGKVKFHVQFDVRGYEPENIQVRTDKNWLNVHAQKTVKTAGGRSSSEYCRTIYVPSSVDKDKFECSLTNDGVLVLEAPVKHDSDLAIKFDRDLQLGIKPPSQVQTKQQQVEADGEKCTDLQVIGQPGPTVLGEGTNKRRLHVEFPVESGFTGDDLSVRVDANRLIVTGHHEVNENKGKFHESYAREFTRWYSIPETVDPFSIQAQVHGNTVVVEAPLVQSP